MPSPVGHALGGLAAGWLLQPRQSPTPPLVSCENLAYVALGIAADFDLVIGVHRGASHSLGATAAAGAVAWFVAQGGPGARRLRPPRAIVAAGVRYAYEAAPVKKASDQK